MALYLFNTLTGRKERFEPIDPPRVKMYVCGVTVYDLTHIGHARSLLVFDVLFRYLGFLGYEVTYVRNFTDIDDKIIQKAQSEGISYREIAQRYICEFYVDTDPLGLKRPTVEPRATDHIPDMIEAVKKLLDKGYAYVADGDVYFSVEKFPGYGKLSGRSLDEMMAGARVEPDPKKRNPFDFVLWKASKPGEPFWDSPWGKGRPGWHLECSVMSQKYLGETLDIHGGGQDLIFPHHENEIAQSEALSGKPFVRYWVHSGFVQVKGEKMSKSLKNIVTLKEVLNRFHPEAVRLFLLSRHYRSPVEYTEEGLKESQRALERLYDFLLRLQGPFGQDGPMWKRVWELTEGLVDRFKEAMSDDLNTPRALGLLFELVKEVNKTKLPIPSGLAWRLSESLSPFKEVLGILKENAKEFFEVLRLKRLHGKGISIEEVLMLIKEREEARRSKDWQKADEIREKLSSYGIRLMDTPQGTRWEVDGDF